jgi:hypothetical protein
MARAHTAGEEKHGNMAGLASFACLFFFMFRNSCGGKKGILICRNFLMFFFVLFLMGIHIAVTRHRRPSSSSIMPLHGAQSKKEGASSQVAFGPVRATIGISIATFYFLEGVLRFFACFFAKSASAWSRWVSFFAMILTSSGLNIFPTCRYL